MSDTSLHNIPITASAMTDFVPSAASAAKPENDRPLHQVAVARRNQAVSVASCARKLGISVQEARRQEQPTTDLTLSQLMAWKKVLDVPLSELIGPIEDELENPIRNRAMLVKVMKSAKQVRRLTRESRIRIISDNLIEQLVLLMPELESITAWPDVGQSHEARSLGQAAYRQFDPEVARRLEI
ncbi:MAG: hypothetical protein ACOX6D_08810 [Thermoguttaceae bacterium]|jgi:transcriptional regulator with XRE-family HTH domain